ncbi:LysR family transcriptional regulator [Pseudidiomarina insulisalsae]|uniref:LysR family transcriptional regulator n=1 Tax=Pseudidiomarina insulisalsae TaxID=575789 RepID=A0A432YLY7_9GAMM|nr:LysR family transcriptional regulator [Pseudidiomarina insulisalsae]RUO61855.1 LysR family transcriptional regulator [Pseudidiomarina insulisalsae]
MTSSYRPRTTIEQWRILQAVVDFGGYAQAAQALNKSQSSMNHAVAKLQDTLGVKLLQVQGRKAELTDIGEVMLRRSRQLTVLVTELEQLAENLKQGWEPEIKLAIEMVFDRNLLLPVLKEFQLHSRGSRLIMEDTVLTGSLETIIHKRADIVITHQVPKGYVGEPIANFQLHLVVSNNHPLAQRNQPLSPDELSQHLQIVIRDTAQKPLEQQGWLRAEQRWTVNNFNEALQLVEAGIGFCWLPPFTIQQSTQLTELQLAGGSHRSGATYLVLPKDEKTGPCARLLYDMLVSELTNSGPFR